MRLAVLAAALIVTAPALASKWDSANDPTRLQNVTGVPVVANFARLPLAAKLSNPHYIWSDTWWPSYWGGIAYRWNAEPNPQNFKYRMLSREEVKRASLSDLEKLSPTEKYDIFMGRYDYPLTKKVLSLYNPRMQWWEGICHGWSLAAITTIEPARNDIMSKDGVLVPFGSSDVKGLLDFYYAKVHETDRRVQVGKRCNVRGKVPGEAYPQDRVRSEPDLDSLPSECNDVNAGAFHMALANMIGLQDKGIVMEVDRYADIWNQPVGEYSSRVVSTRPARNGGSIVQIKTDMTYGEELNTLDPAHRNDDGGFMSMNPVTGTDQQTFSTRHYEYTLELDAAGNITGGEWISSTRPDFFWMKAGATTFIDGAYGLSGLNQIYRPVVD